MSGENKIDIIKQINAFEERYEYDCTYMRELLESSPEGYEKFCGVMPLAMHRDLLDPTTYWVAKLAAMKSEDCGECLQLNVRLALEAGIDKVVVAETVQGGSNLPAELQDVYRFSQGVAANRLNDDALIDRVESRFSKGQLLEFGLCIGMAKFFPITRRAAGYTRSCSSVEIAV